MSERISATYNDKDEEGNVTGTVSGEVDYDFGDTLDEAIELFTEEVILSLFKQSAVIKAQSQLRSCLKADKDEDGINAHFGTWKPGIAVARVAKDPKAEGLKAFEKMTPEERVDYIEELQRRAAQG